MAGIQKVSFTSPDGGYDPDVAQIERQRKLAEMLQAQSMQPLETNQMAGGWVVPVSPMQGLAKMAESWASGRAENRAEELAKQLREKRQSEVQGDMSAYVKALQGRPAVSSELTPQEYQQSSEYGTPNVERQAQPAVPPGRLDPSLIPQLKTPQMQQMAMQQLISQMQPKAPIKLGQGDSLLDPNTYKPIATAPKDPKFHVVGGNLVPEPQPGAAPGATVAPVYTAPDKDETAKLNAVLTAAGIDPASAEGKALFGALAKKMATHQPGTNVVTNVSTEKKYGEQFAGKIAAADSDMRDAAIKAPQLAERANQVLKLLSDGKVITGTGADFRLAFAKAAKLAGVGNGTAADTEQVATMLAQNTLDAIKASGLGSGSGFSNADRDFLEKAVGGKIGLEKETLQRLASLSHRAAVVTADRWNKRVKEIPRSALEGTGVSNEPVGIPSLFGAPGAAPAAGSDPLGLRR